MNNRGKLITIEGSKSVAEITRQNFKDLGLSRIYSEIGRFQDILELVINEIIIAPSLSDLAILVFNDLDWSKGMKRAWKAVISDNRIKFSINLIKMGICVISKSKNKKRNFKLLLI